MNSNTNSSTASNSEGNGPQETQGVAGKKNLFLPKECYRFFEFKAHEEQKKLNYKNDLQFEFKGESLLALGSVLRSYIRAEVESKIGVKSNRATHSKKAVGALLKKKFRVPELIQKMQEGITMKSGCLNPLITAAEERLCANCRVLPVQTPCLCSCEQCFLSFDEFMKKLLFCSEDCHKAYHQKHPKKRKLTVDDEEIQDRSLKKMFYLVENKGGKEDDYTGREGDKGIEEKREDDNDNEGDDDEAEDEEEGKKKKKHDRDDDDVDDEEEDEEEEKKKKKHDENDENEGKENDDNDDEEENIDDESDEDFYIRLPSGPRAPELQLRSHDSHKAKP